MKDNFQHLPQTFAFALKAGITPEQAVVLPALVTTASLVGEIEIPELLNRAMADSELEKWFVDHCKVVAEEMSK